MSDPITAMAVGAAIGGGTSLARGKGFGSALQSAAIGGALGGGGSYLGGLMGGAGATGGASTGSGLLSGFQGVATTPVSMGTGGFASGIGGQVIPNAITSVAPTVAETVAPNFSTSFMNEYVPQNLVTQGTELPMSTVASQPSTYAEGIQDVYRPQFENFSRGASEGFTGGGYNPNGGLFGSVKDMFGGLSTSDKLGLGLKGIDIAMRPEERIPPPQVNPIRQGNPEMVSTPLYNVAPNVGRQAGNEIGLPNLISRMPLTEEEKYRLQQAAQRGYRG